jgi:ankyrin repeat protein
MKQLLITIAAVVLVGCGNNEADNALRSALNLESVKQAIADGANVKAKDERGWTVLHFAQTKEIAELLIAKGADVNAQDEDGETPLDYANRVKRTEIADLLRKHGGKTGEELKAEGK